MVLSVKQQKSVNQKCGFCYHLVSLMLFQTCMTICLLLNTKEVIGNRFWWPLTFISWTQKERHFLISTAITPVFSVTWSFKNPIFSHQWKIRSCINCKKKFHKKPLQQYNSNTTTELKSSEVSFNPINTLRCNIVPFMFVRLTERSPQQRQFLLTWKRGLLNINYIR